MNVAKFLVRNFKAFVVITRMLGFGQRGDALLKLCSAARRSSYELWSVLGVIDAPESGRGSRRSVTLQQYLRTVGCSLARTRILYSVPP